MTAKRYEHWEVDPWLPWSWRDFPLPPHPADTREGLVVQNQPSRSRRPRRPAWHKPAGIAVIVAALALVVLNDLVLIGLRTPLPGGHSEGYFVAGLAGAFAGAWLTGVMDARGG